jgi:hypothetical protein
MANIKILKFPVKTVADLCSLSNRSLAGGKKEASPLLSLKLSKRMAFRGLAGAEPKTS